eukprot:GFYU01001136.1.p1 GENE.GFYU01001136.1~~GFYU01001136.1.p1  ORF type:complete len:601 (-),score=206.02 GFYU01001136.1:388-2031(-)
MSTRQPSSLKRVYDSLATFMSKPTRILPPAAPAPDPAEPEEKTLPTPTNVEPVGEEDTAMDDSEPITSLSEQSSDDSSDSDSDSSDDSSDDSSSSEEEGNKGPYLAKRKPQPIAVASRLQSLEEKVRDIDRQRELSLDILENVRNFKEIVNDNIRALWDTAPADTIQEHDNSIKRLKEKMDDVERHVASHENNIADVNETLAQTSAEPSPSDAVSMHRNMIDSLMKSKAEISQVDEVHRSTNSLKRSFDAFEDKTESHFKECKKQRTVQDFTDSAIKADIGELKKMLGDHRKMFHGTKEEMTQDIQDLQDEYEEQESCMKDLSRRVEQQEKAVHTLQSENKDLKEINQELQKLVGKQAMQIQLLMDTMEKNESKIVPVVRNLQKFIEDQATPTAPPQDTQDKSDDNDDESEEKSAGKDNKNNDNKDNDNENGKSCEGTEYDDLMFAMLADECCSKTRPVVINDDSTDSDRNDNSSDDDSDATSQQESVELLDFFRRPASTSGSGNGGSKRGKICIKRAVNLFASSSEDEYSLRENDSSSSDDDDRDD